MGERLADLGEFGLIRRLRERFPPAGGVTIGIGDDAAAVRIGPEALLTTDLLVEGVHFDLKLGAPADHGFKALAVSVSDIAAMGGRPRYALVGLGAPAELGAKTMEELAEGIAEAGEVWSLAVVGGDLVVADRLVLAVTVVGEPGPGGALRRSGARPGDTLFVTGEVGTAAAGLGLLQLAASNAGASAALARHPELARRALRGTARVREGAAAAGAGAHAMIDVSDGVGADAGHLAEASRCGLEIDAAALPISDAVRDLAGLLDADPIMLGLAGGEDYELLIAGEPEGAEDLRARIHPTALTPIGRFIEGGERQVVFPDGSRRQIEGLGWEHFR